MLNVDDLIQSMSAVGDDVPVDLQTAITGRLVSFVNGVTMMRDKIKTSDEVKTTVNAVCRKLRTYLRSPYSHNKEQAMQALLGVQLTLELMVSRQMPMPDWIVIKQWLLKK